MIFSVYRVLYLLHFLIKSKTVKMTNMKRVLLLCICLFSTCITQYSFSQSATRNFILSERMLKDSVYTLNEVSILNYREKQSAISYFDGLGREIQSILINGTPTGNDIVSYTEYDKYGRQPRGYLPYADSGGGTFQNNAKTELLYFYSVTPTGDTTTFPWSEQVFDNSPLNRVVEQGSPGSTWTVGGGHTIKQITLTNSTNEVPLWKVDNEGRCVKDGYYQGRTLLIALTINENGDTISQYTDKSGKTLLKKTHIGTDVLETYYVYDSFDLLRYVLSPKAVKNLGSTTVLTPDSARIKGLCYYYEYDSGRRMKIKQLPGADQVYMVYDKRDRLVLSQDGENREYKKWLFTKYDAFNRPVLSGILTMSSSQTQAAMQTIVNNVYSGGSPRAYSVTRNSSLTTTLGYTDASFPISTDGTLEYLSATYYDDYDFPGKEDFDNTSNISGYTDNEGSVHYFDNVKGKVTGTKAKVLNTATEYITTTNYYDDHYRIIESLNNLYGESSAGEILSTRYDFTGNVIQSSQKQTFNTVLTTIVKYYTYDHMGRLQKTESEINGSNRITVSEMTYNELGQLTKKGLHKSGTQYLQEVDYKYNIRGWLSKINEPDNLGSDLFAMRLLYENSATLTNLTKENQHNGNISGVIWNRRSGVGATDTTKSAYTFIYDKADRIINNYYGEGISLANSAKYREYDYTYDMNGNIMTLKRNNGTGTQIDNLTYSYLSNRSNQLSAVTDNTSDTTGFNNRNISGNDYSYDANGNLTKDLNKGITEIEYNLLNLPKTITKDATHSITYYYDAMGRKLMQEVEDGANTTSRYYLDGFEYDNRKELLLIQMDEGVINVSISASVFEYEYHLKDHLGNTRIAFKNSSGTPTITQSADYYPFGLQFVPTYMGGTNKYLYNGKELQDESLGGVNLDWYDFNLRYYDPKIARWTTVDPKAEKYRRWSPYNYCINNPIKYFDPNGDTITLSDAFRNNKEWMVSYNAWSQTKAGQRFSKNYGIGGESESVSVVFDIGEKVLGASATTGAYTVNKETGKETLIEPDKDVDNANAIVSGTDKDSYFRAHLYFFPGGTTTLAEGAESISHETQHVRIDRQTLITDKMVAPSWMQHDWMRPRNSGWYQERYSMFQSVRTYWQNDYQLQLINGKVKNEQEYIDIKINDFNR
jgi:RHS repeat-associated protein